MRKCFLLVPIVCLSVLPFVKAESLDPPCPEGRGGWFCYGFKLASWFDLGATIATCGANNGSLAKNEVASFAVDYTLKKIKPSSRKRALNDLREMIQDRSDYKQTQLIKANIITGGGCAMVLNKYYPKFSRVVPKDPSSLRDTMSDTPFQW